MICSTALNFTDNELSNCLASTTENRGADGVIFTAGPSMLLNTCLDKVRNGGFINLFSHLTGEVSPIDTSALYHRELQIITTYSASPASLKKAFAILQNSSLNLKRLIAPFYHGPKSLEKAVADINCRKILKAVITF